MDVGVQAIGFDGEVVERLGGEALAERRFSLLPTEYTGTRAGDGDANAAAKVSHKHAGHRVTRRRVRKLLVRGALRDREKKAGDDVVGFERGFEHALEEIVGRDFLLERLDGGVQ